MLMPEPIPIGTRVTVRLDLDAGAGGPAALAIAWSGGGQTGEHDECVAAPGGFCEALVTPGMRGLCRVIVDMSTDADTGTLSVDPVTDSMLIQGDVSCLYLVR